MSALADAERHPTPASLHVLVSYRAAPPETVDDRASGVGISDVMRRHVDAAVPHRAGYGDVAGRVLYINSQCARIFGASPTLTCANVLAWLFEVPEARAIMLEWAQESAWLWPGCEA